MNPINRTKQIRETARSIFVPNYGEAAVALVRGEGSRLWDADDREYIDLGTGISVNSLGQQHPDLVAALENQSRELWHVSNLYYSQPAIELGRLLTEHTFAEQVFLCNSGAEANEAAIKLARRHASLHRPAGQRSILSFTGSFHGRTLATVTATAQPKYHEGFGPLPGGFHYAPFNDFHAAEKMIDGSFCAVIIEPIQGEGGVYPSAPGFLSHLRQLCDHAGALLILDEIQSGMGRTGRLLAHQWEQGGVTPDIVTLAKALGGGLPLGAMLTSRDIAASLAAGSHGTTFGGNPICSAVACAMLRNVTRPELLENVTERGKQLMWMLDDYNRQHGLFKTIRGRGLMIGAELSEKFAGGAAQCLACCRGEGVIILVAGPDVLRFLPPLNISEADLDEALTRLQRGLDQFRAGA